MNSKNKRNITVKGFAVKCVIYPSATTLYGVLDDFNEAITDGI